MGKITKSGLYLAMTFTIMLLMVNYVSFSLISHNEIVSDCECPDFSKHCDYPHTFSFEDDILHNETSAKPYKLEILQGFLLFANPDFTNGFNSKIWQPPKNS